MRNRVWTFEDVVMDCGGKLRLEHEGKGKTKERSK
jgi:hypothetical protein